MLFALTWKHDFAARTPWLGLADAEFGGQDRESLDFDYY
jgi:hypothetical protein